MDSLLKYILFVTIISSITAASTYKYEIKTFEVPLDHFGYASNKTFKIRYLINDTFVRNNQGPILFYTGNEGDIELFAENTGLIWEIADELEGLIVFAEHRYYGKSLPFGDKSFSSPEHLGYLTSEQALADFALLLDNLNPTSRKTISKNRPVIAFGGSYGGMLAAWIRMKYPYLVEGAIAASAPIFQFTDLTPCDIFDRIVTSVFTTNNHECSQNIKKSWSVLRKMASSPEGRTNLTKIFHLCGNFSKPEDQDAFDAYLIDVYGNLAMVNYPYETNFLAQLPAYPVREFCGQLAAPLEGIKLIEALQSAINIYSNFTGHAKCLNISSAYNDQLDDSGWNVQACTEMVMPMCSTDSANSMFPKAEWNFQTYSDDCFKKYGVRPRERAVITQYGGTNLEGASNIVFSNGLLDPWSGGGVLRSPNEKIKIIIIPEGAHHLDLRARNPNDPESVKQARNMEVAAIQRWIRDYWN